PLRPSIIPTPRGNHKFVSITPVPVRAPRPRGESSPEDPDAHPSGEPTDEETSEGPLGTPSSSRSPARTPSAPTASGSNSRSEADLPPGLRDRASCSSSRARVTARGVQGKTSLATALFPGDVR